MRALHQQISESRFKDVFIFVHGFNNTFEDAARRAAQLAYDLDFDGTPMLYSWPSQGSATAYAMDEAAVGISGRRLADFMETVVAQSGAQRIHLIAHSMGNRALLEALQTYLAKRAPDNRQHIFGQIVFTAPDVDRDYFIDAIDPLRRIAADRITCTRPTMTTRCAARSSCMAHRAPAPPATSSFVWPASTPSTCRPSRPTPRATPTSRPMPAPFLTYSDCCGAATLLRSAAA